jgi:hypothetical protein
MEDIRALAVKTKINLDGLSERTRIVEALVNGLAHKQLKPADELVKMDYDELVRHFDDVSVANSDLIKIMQHLGYKVSAEDKKHLRKSVARQLSETALFAKVAAREKNRSEN